MPRPRLLVINPNTSDRVTAVIGELAREEAGAEAEVTAVTARFGAAYIATRAAAAVAAHAVLDVAAEALAGPAPPDAIVIGCFGDPGLEALRELCGLPVVGFAGAGFAAAAQEPGRFLVATGGTAWCEMLTELALLLGFAPRLAGIISIDEAAQEPGRAAAAVSEAAARTGAARVVLGGAGLIPVFPRIAGGLALPVVDPHRAAIREALRLAREPAAGRRPSASMESRGLSPTLEALMAKK
jgi:Asp/Glu/hydantoin racemase